MTKLWLTLLILVFIGGTGFLVWKVMIFMPGQPYRGRFLPLSPEEAQIADRLKSYVFHLAHSIGPREMRLKYDRLEEAASFIKEEFESMGYRVELQEYEVESKRVGNVFVTKKGDGETNEYFVIGAHYDTVPGSPGANDNATAVASLLVLADRLKKVDFPLTVVFAAFTNEEEPYYHTAKMGSMVFARSLKERGVKVRGMVSLETMGYFSREEDSQDYPPPFGLFYPPVGDFIGFIGNISSRHLVHEMIAQFRSKVDFPAEGAALPSIVPGVGWSDHWSFWQHGWPAVMITDTAPYRYPHYHRPSDTADKVDFARLARVVCGLETVFREMLR